MLLPQIALVVILPPPVLSLLSLSSLLTFCAGPSFGAVDAMAGQTSNSLIHVSTTISRPWAAEILDGSLFGGISNSGAPNTVALPCPLAVTSRQHDAARPELASVWSELYPASEENDVVCLALTLLCDLFHNSRSSLLALESWNDATTLQFSSYSDMRDGSSKLLVPLCRRVLFSVAHSCCCLIVWKK